MNASISLIKIDDVLGKVRGVNRVVNAIADLVMPVATVRANCTGCTSTECGWACIDGIGYKLFREYNISGQCCCYDCWRQCSQATSITC
jgi:hypothetical protein